MSLAALRSPAMNYSTKSKAPKAGEPTPSNVPDNTGTRTSATISGLAPGTTYEVQVLAKNDEGEGGWSPTGNREHGLVDRSLRPSHLLVNEGQSVEITVTLTRQPPRP